MAAPMPTRYLTKSRFKLAVECPTKLYYAGKKSEYKNNMQDDTFLQMLADVRAAFPDMKGFSSSNLKYMRFFAQTCPNGLIGQQAADQLPWFHIVTILTKISNEAERAWYAAQVIQQGWSRSMLESHIKNKLHLRQGSAVTNFDRHLPTPHAQLATAALKDP